MDGGWVRHAIAEASSKQVSCGRGGQNMGSGRCGGRLYIKISREAPLRAEQDLPATVVRKWDEEQRLHHRTSSSALPPLIDPVR